MLGVVEEMAVKQARLKAEGESLQAEIDVAKEADARGRERRGTEP